MKNKRNIDFSPFFTKMRYICTMNKKKILSLFMVVSVFCTLFLGCTKQKRIAQEEPQRTVRIAIQPSAAFMPLYIARYAGFIDEALAQKNASVIWQDFESGPPIQDSLIADLSDLGVIGDVPSVLTLAAPVPMKLVGIPASGSNAYAMLARTDNAKLNTYKDLKGACVATIVGSTGHNFTKKLLEKAGVSFDEISFIGISATDAELHLQIGNVDAVVIWEPNITRFIDKGLAKIVAQGDETDLRGTNGFIVREEFLRDNADIVSTILQQYDCAVQAFDSLDEALLKKVASELKITVEQMQRIAKKYQFSVEITQADIDSLQDTANFLVSIGTLSQSPHIADYVDTSCFSRN